MRYKESGLNKNDLIESLLDHYNEIVPIIGEDMFVYKGDYSDGKEVPVRSYLLNRFQNDFGIQLDAEMINTILKQDFYGLSIMHKTFKAKGKDYVAKYKKYIIEAENKDEIFIKEYVRDFLTTFKFPLIITTSSFKFIENILIKNALSYNSIWYNPKGDNRNPLPTSKNVYHIFGTAYNTYDWVYDENMLLKFMHSFHEKDFMADNLINFIRNGKKRLMVLGCNMPDWLFRFLWYPMYSDYHFEGEQGYWINDSEVEDSLDNFLQEVNYASNDEVKYILEEVTAKRKKITDNNEKSIPKKDKYDVFISYASEDYELVKIIYKLLTDRNVDAWFDEDGSSRIIEGENYMNKIRESVPKCRYYMPIITESFLKKSLLPESNLTLETNVINDFFNTLDNSLKDNYSLPIIILNQKFNGNVIDTKLVEGLSILGILKSHFYFQKKMLSFDVNNQEAFLNLNWGTIIKKSN